MIGGQAFRLDIRGLLIRPGESVEGRLAFPQTQAHQENRMTENFNAGVIPGLYDAPPSSEVTRGPHELEILHAEWRKFGVGKANPGWGWNFRIKAVDQQGSVPYYQNVFLPYGAAPEGEEPLGMPPATDKDAERNADKLSAMKTVLTIFGVAVSPEGGVNVKDFEGKRSARPVLVTQRTYEGRVSPETSWTTVV